MEEKVLKASDIPMGYAMCFNSGCADKDTLNFRPRSRRKYCRKYLSTTLSMASNLTTIK